MASKNSKSNHDGISRLMSLNDALQTSFAQTMLCFAIIQQEQVKHF